MVKTYVSFWLNFFLLAFTFTLGEDDAWGVVRPEIKARRKIGEPPKLLYPPTTKVFFILFKQLLFCSYFVWG